MRTKKLIIGAFLFLTVLWTSRNTSLAASVPWSVLSNQDVNVGKGDSVRYGNWSTSNYSVCDADGVTRMAYCVDPVRTGPSGGVKNGVTIYRYDSASMPLAAAIYLHTAGGPLTDYSYLLPDYDATNPYKTYAYVHAAIAYALHTGFEDSETTGVDINEFKPFFDACGNDSENSRFEVQIKVYDFGGNMQRLTAAYFEEIPQTNSLYITKGDADNSGVLLAGAVYGVYSDAECNSYITSFAATGKNGRALAKVAKSYNRVFIKEIKAPYGYRLSEEVTEVIVNDGDNEVGEKFDTIQKGRIVLQKYDRNLGKYDPNDENDDINGRIVVRGSLKGAIYGLYAKDDIKHPGTKEIFYAAGELIESKETDDKGFLTFDDLWLGKYEIREEQASKGYEVNIKPIVFTMPQDNSPSAVAEYRVDAPEDVIRRKVKILKSKEGGTPLEGIEFLIFKKGNEGDWSENYALTVGPGQTKKLVTDANGEAVSSLLEFGEYTLLELNPPKGYDNPGRIHFKITEEGSEPIELKVVNHPHRNPTPAPTPVGRLTLVMGANTYRKSNYQTSDTGDGYSVQIKQEYTSVSLEEPDSNDVNSGGFVGSDGENSQENGRFTGKTVVTAMFAICVIAYAVFKIIKR